MRIALDYDKTYTADPELWDAFIRSSEQRGHEVRIVTMRHQATESIQNAPVEVLYSERKAKCKVYAADVWIDDSPSWIYQDSP